MGDVKLRQYPACRSRNVKKNIKSCMISIISDVDEILLKYLVIRLRGEEVLVPIRKI